MIYDLSPLWAWQFWFYQANYHCGILKLASQVKEKGIPTLIVHHLHPAKLSHCTKNFKRIPITSIKNPYEVLRFLFASFLSRFLICDCLPLCFAFKCFINHGKHHWAGVVKCVPVMLQCQENKSTPCRVCWFISVISWTSSEREFFFDLFTESFWAATYCKPSLCKGRLSAPLSNRWHAHFVSHSKTTSSVSVERESSCCRDIHKFWSQRMFITILWFLMCYSTIFISNPSLIYRSCPIVYMSSYIVYRVSCAACYFCKEISELYAMEQLLEAINIRCLFIFMYFSCSLESMTIEY